MAKKLGKRASKKGFDTRDFLVWGGYLLLILWLTLTATSSREKNRLIKQQEAELSSLQTEKVTLSRKIKLLKKEVSEEKARVENSEVKLKREKQEYDFVVGTSLEYAKKNRILMAIWEAIDKVRNVAIKDVTVAKNDVTLNMVTRSDVYLTEFMTELNQRQDLVSTIRIKETKLDRSGKKAGEELLVGLMNIVAKRSSKSNLASSITSGEGL